MILLDTDHVTELRHPASHRGQRLAGRLATVGGEVVGITIVTIEEQLRGWAAEIARQRRVANQVTAYANLADAVAYFGRVNVVPFDQIAAKRFDDLKAAKVRIGTMDLKIAAIALTRDALLLSANLRDFRHVPGLRVENWLD